MKQPILPDTIIVGSKVCFSNSADDAAYLSPDSGAQAFKRMKELICTDGDLGILRLKGVRAR